MSKVVPTSRVAGMYMAGLRTTCTPAGSSPGEGPSTTQLSGSVPTTTPPSYSTATSPK